DLDVDFKHIDFKKYDAVFDLNLDENPENLEAYISLTGKIVVASAVKKQLTEIASYFVNDVQCVLAGINALPTFLSRSKAEVSAYMDSDKNALGAFFQSLGWEYHFVNDRVGMVSPRIVCMIINEAFYTLQEGTATAEDIDESMKLGTNYPKGPFQWANEMGIKAVYETLDALYLDTRDERYKICPMLKTAYLREN
ncbi:MAG: 3-hydroxyacyl-CoA dehydrogenase family protein, partial [Bacteroidia bacterium]